jgi:hypothetical protein
MENQEQAQFANAEGVSPAPAPAPELNIVDLQNLRAVVETAVKRGAFNANELTAVGSVYDRISTFLNAVTQKPADAPAEANAPAEAPATAE